MEKKVGLSKRIVIKLSEEIVLGNDEMEQHSQSCFLTDHKDEFLSESECYIEVDKELNIYLPCFVNKKNLLLPPLLKTMFLFFLLHEEGAFIYQLDRYKKELLSLYKLSVNKKTDDVSLENIIDNLVFISNKRFYENLSFLKRRLITVFGKQIARNFYVVKNENGKYFISLDRSKIKWDLNKNKVL